MKTTAALKASALLLLLLALPGVAKAQPVDRTRPVSVADTVTGIDASPAGMAVPVPAMNPDVLKDYMRALEAVDMAVEFEARGATRAAIGVDKVKIDARWERRAGETSPVLRGMTIKPDGGRLNLGGMGVNKITIDERGVMKLDIHRFPDLTVRKITRNANGDVKLHIDWFPDITIKADGNVKLLGLIGLGNVGPNGALGGVVSNWPPRMEDVVAALSQPMPAATTRHEGTVRWDIRGRAAPFPMRLADGSNLPAATSFSVRGAGVLEPDGTFRTIGAGNAVTVNVNVGGRRVAMSGVSGTVESGTATFSGRYAVSIPRGKKENLVLDVNGDVSYAIDGNDVTVNLPTGTRVRVSDVDVSGTAHLTARVAPASGNNVVLSDGTYKLDATGPISVHGLRVRGVTSDEIGLDGRIHAEGAFTPEGNGLTVTGSGTGEVRTTGPGLVDVVVGNDRVRGTVREGSTVNFDVAEFSATTAAEPSTGSATLENASARGTVNASVDLAGVNANVAGNSITADAVHADGAFTIEGTERGLTGASGTATVRLDSDGTLRARMPAAELPGELGAVTHRVVAGDTLYRIARANNVSVPALRAANGLTGDEIAVGSTLRIPGPASSQPTPSRPATDGSLATTVDRGSTVAVNVRSARMTPRGLEIDGHLTARVSVSNLDVVSGKLEAKILGAARASLDTDFTVRPGRDGRPVVRTGSFRVPVRIEIGRGSRVVVNLPGRETDIVMDRDGSYAEFTAVVKLDDAGNMQVDELAAVDVLLTSNGTARFGGDMVDIPGEKTIRYTGRVVMRERGLDFYGDITLNVRGPADRPIVRIRW